MLLIVPFHICYASSGDMLSILKHIDMDLSNTYISFWSQASDPVLFHDPFSTLMWVLFCLPHPFLSCEESLLSLVHVFYIVAVTQVGPLASLLFYLYFLYFLINSYLRLHFFLI